MRAVLCDFLPEINPINLVFYSLIRNFVPVKGTLITTLLTIKILLFCRQNEKIVIK